MVEVQQSGPVRRVSLWLPALDQSVVATDEHVPIAPQAASDDLLDQRSSDAECGAWCNAFRFANVTNEASCAEIARAERAMRDANGPRIMVVWCPDWPVVVAAAAAGAGSAAAAGGGRAQRGRSPARRRPGSRGYAAGCGAGTPPRAARSWSWWTASPSVEMRTFEVVLVGGRGDLGRRDPDPTGAVRPDRWPAGSTAARPQAAADRGRALVGGRGLGLPDRHRRRHLRRRAGGSAGGAAGLLDRRSGRLGAVPGRPAGQPCWTTPTWSALLRRLGIRSLGDFAGARRRATC